MSHPFLYGNPYYLLLSLSIICYASFTMMSMLNHTRQESTRPTINWLVGAAVVYSLGLWTMHVVSLLASDFLLIVDWSMIATFAACVLTVFWGLHLLYRKPYRSRMSEVFTAMLVTSASALLHYISILSNAIQTYSIHYIIFGVSIVISFVGTYSSILLLRKRSTLRKAIGSILLGMSSMTMHQLGMHAMTVEYRDILTIERFNDYLLLLAFILIITTFLIISFSLTTWFNVRKYAVIDERYKLLVENSMDTIALIKNGKWEYINPSGLKLFEAESEKDLIGVSVYDLLDEKHHPCIRAWLESELLSDKEPAMPMELMWLTLKGKPIYTELIRVRASFYGSPFEQVIIRDISERKKNEELLINAEKLSIAGQLAAGIAHEIRNPLTSLKGFMQLIATGRIHNNHYYTIMKSELVRIETIISELLMLSKPQVYEYAHIDLRQLINESASHLSTHAILYNVRIEYEEWNQPLWVLGVESQLKQVIINVMKNAIESMQNGGRLSIQLEIVDNETVIIRIQDEGIGITQEQLSKIGQPFYTTKDKGTGLGLMVTYKIIDNHNGEISAESELGVGTVFTIRLPFHAPSEEGLIQLQEQM